MHVVPELEKLRDALAAGEVWYARNIVSRMQGARDGRRMALPGPEQHARMLVADVGLDRAEAEACRQRDGAQHWMVREHYVRVGSVLCWLRACAEHGA